MPSIRSASFHWAPFLATLALLTSPAIAQIPWAKSLDDALLTAADNKTVVMVVVRVPGERASDRIEQALKRDKQLAELGAQTSNVLLRVGPGGTYEPDVKLLKERYLDLEPDEAMPAPLHLFIQPDGKHGKLLHSSAFALTAGQLEWAWVDAIRQAQPAFEWEFSPATRAPERIRFDGAEAAIQIYVAPSDEEVEQAMKEVKKSGGGGRRGAVRGVRATLTHLRVIIRSPAKKAIKFGVNTMRSFGGRGVSGQILRAVGDHSPEAWSSVAVSLLKDRATGNREEAARALEQLLAPKSIRALTKQWKAETELAVRGRLLRAMAAVGPANKTAIHTVKKAATKHRDDAIRVQAVAAAATLHDSATVHEIVTAALNDSHPDVRIAAAWVAASRRDPALLNLVEARAKTESGAEAQEPLQAAIDAVKKRQSLKAFKSFRKDTLGDRLTRRPMTENVFGGGGRGGAGRGGGNGSGGGAQRSEPAR